MLVKDLNGREYKLKIGGKLKSRSRSKLHNEAIEIIKEVYPLINICNEVPIKIKPGQTLYLDIFLPDFNLVIEIQGKQHFQFTPVYHKYPHRFGRSQLNDDLKREWCHVNDINIIYFNYNDKDEWHDRLAKATGKIR